MTRDEMNKWVEAYIEYQGTPKSGGDDDPDFWPVEQFIDLMPEDPEICWQAILEILHREPPDEVIGVLAAGPLEDLIEDHGAKFIDAIEEEARINPDFRHLLGGAWESSTPEVWNRVLKARNNKSW